LPDVVSSSYNCKVTTSFFLTLLYGSLEEDEQDDEGYASAASSCVSTADSASTARRAQVGRPPRRGVAAGCSEVVLEAWAKRIGLALMTLRDGYTVRGERKERREVYQRENPPEGKASCRVAAAEEDGVLAIACSLAKRRSLTAHLWMGRVVEVSRHGSILSTYRVNRF